MSVSQAILKVLTQNLQAYPSLAKEVQGYNSFVPVDLQNLLGPLFTRNIDQTLGYILNDLRNNSQIIKTNLNTFLLEKYLGNSPNNPHAYHAMPENTSEDFQLHLCFLQPFRLYGIERKYVGLDPETVNREWLWADCNGSDSAPLFRKIIQIYILNDILMDSNIDTAKNPNQLKDQLLQELNQEVNTLFQRLADHFDHVNNIQGNSNGLLSEHHEEVRLLDYYLLPGFLDTANLYPLGRLLFGQTKIEAHHAIANHQAKGWLNYIFVFLLSHLNLSTSVFWIKTGLRIMLNQWKDFKTYITTGSSLAQIGDTTFSFSNRLLQTLLLIPNTLILAASPLLILIPAIYGVTSLPFSLLRHFCLEGPFNRLKNFKILRIIDTIELTKDCLLFFFVAVPMMNFLLTAIILTFPPLLLTIGSTTSYFVLATLFTFLALIVFVDLFNRHPFKSILFTSAIGASFSGLISGTNFSIFCILSLIANIGIYLSTSWIAKTIHSLTPTNVLEKISYLASPLIQIVLKIEIGLEHLLNNRIDLSIDKIIPVDQQQPNLKLQPSPFLVLAGEEQALVDQYKLELGKLIQTFNLSVERKKMIRACILNLTITEETKRETLDQAKQQAGLLLQDNFTVNEVSEMQQALTRLKEIDKDLKLNMESNAIKTFEQQNTYQPSEQFIQILHAKELFHKLPVEIQTKCNHICKHVFSGTMN